MTDDQRAIQLKQLANIVIDAYLNRDKQFIPSFGEYNGIMYLTRPEGDKDHSKLELNFFYDRADYEPENHS
jgi:hypothetical protein